jgi:hypothetical protein
MAGARCAARVAIVAAFIAVAHPGPLLAHDDDGDFGSRVFEGEPADGQPLEGVPDESRKLEAAPAESMPLDGPVDSRVTDSEANDGLTVDPGPREMISEDDDSSAAGGLKEAEPADDDDGSVESGPKVKERIKKEDGY